ncbi:MAG: tetratricopeptide repeat protein [Deltaproteobacteria bacterium]|nr:tetratricopeptide repeat protein [Deltaproteobacteria bacterium]
MRRLVIYGICLFSLPGQAAPLEQRAAAAALAAAGALADGENVKAVRWALQGRQLTRAKSLFDALVGLIAYDGGRIVDAFHLLQRAQEGSTDPLIHYWYARAALRRGKSSTAYGAMRRAVALGGDRALLRLGMAATAQALGRAQEARQSLRIVAERVANIVDPSLFPTARYGAVQLVIQRMRNVDRTSLMRTEAVLAWRTGAYFLAHARFAGLLKRRAGDADSGQMVVQCLVKLGRERQACELARRALVRFPRHIDLAIAVANCEIEQRRYAAAVPLLRRAVERRPRDADLLTLLAQACTESGDVNCAERYFRFALLRKPELAAAQLGLGKLLLGRREYRRAELRLMAAIRADPTVSDGYLAAADLLDAVKRRAAARRLLARGKRLAQRLAPLERRVAQATAEAGRISQALEQCACRGEVRCRAVNAASCRAAVGALTGVVRRWFLAHLRGGQPPPINVTRPLLSAHPATLLQDLGPHYGKKVLKRSLPVVRADLLAR